MNNSYSGARIKKRFNIVDFFIIAAVIACACGAVLRFNLIEKLNVGAAKDTVEISFYVHNISDYSAQALVAGDNVYNGSLHMGTLGTIEIGKAEYYIENSEGVLELTYDETRYDIRGTIIGSGTMAEDGFMLNNNTYIAAGKEMLITTKNINVNVLITGVTVTTGS
jgi:hypothetical protein